jgi:ATP-dependent RNA helicase DeaD
MRKFEEMEFAPGILKAIQELGFEKPMPVQEKVIPMILKNDKDIIALAQTGTGKTAAFGLPLVQLTDTTAKDTQALILCPTRELCIQISGDLMDYARYSDNLKILSVYGGASIENQIRALKKGVHVIVATPGRLIDLIGRGVVKLSRVSTVILDEADEMLNMGFLDSINEILDKVPEGRRTLLFSATMSPVILAIAVKYMYQPEEITIGTKNSSAENVSHGYCMVHAKDKYKVLKRITDFEPGIYGIVFCRTRKDTQEIASKLINDGYNANALHGDLNQSQRDAVMQKFRSGSISLLVATDVAARGLDVDNLTHVINFSLPDDPEVYTHRCGRTGRAGKKGMSISLVHMKEKNNLRRIEREVKKPFKAIPVPTGSEICSRQLFNWVSKIETVSTGHREIERFLPDIRLKLEKMEREELIRRIVSFEFDRILDDYRHGEEFIDPLPEKDFRHGKQEQKDTAGKNQGSYSRLFINIGKSDGLSPEQLIDLINVNTKGKKIPVGKIDILKGFSFFEIKPVHVDGLIGALNNKKFMGTRIALEPALKKTDKRRNKEYTGGKDDRRSKKRNGKKGIAAVRRAVYEI